jgi:hypothetical protein
MEVAQNQTEGQNFILALFGYNTRELVECDSVILNFGVMYDF